MMTPEQMRRWLNGLGQAADVVEAIDQPELARCRGWDLTGWSYRLVPWGVRFTFRSADAVADAEVLAVLNLSDRADTSAFARGPADRPLLA